MQKVVMILSCVVHLSRACGDCTRAHEGKLTGGKLGYVYMEPYQPFPVPVQVRLLKEVVDELKTQRAGFALTATGDTSPPLGR